MIRVRRRPTAAEETLDRAGRGGSVGHRRSGADLITHLRRRPTAADVTPDRAGPWALLTCFNRANRLHYL